MYAEPEVEQRVEKINVLTTDQLGALNHAKLQVMIRMDNEQYLRDHPDVAKAMRALVRGIIRERPTDVGLFAYRFFRRSEELIRRDLDAKE
ncbi:TPA: hypothetical protein N0F65_007390 [Lagenidium giganteum]|uniref:RIIa domain-containing protein n=1 Tax=Lagenidium giganteum TaxID=4803 RepID=A0AAV2ZE71_9STRA|nr:TPA: hypothetical protein N0F65_007390 [Lagenidium giganteum]